MISNYYIKVYFGVAKNIVALIVFKWIAKNMVTRATVTRATVCPPIQNGVLFH